MKKCIVCGKEKKDTEFRKSSKSKDGLQHTCISCKRKQKKQLKIKYRKTKGLINPVNPIPLKNVGDDGFGGKWFFNVKNVKQCLESNRLLHSQKNYLVNRNCLQVKSADKQCLNDFCLSIDMNLSAIIEFDKLYGKVYVVNLYHPNILEIVK